MDPITTAQLVRDRTAALRHTAEVARLERSLRRTEDRLASAVAPDTARPREMAPDVRGSGAGLGGGCRTSDQAA